MCDDLIWAAFLVMIGLIANGIARSPSAMNGLYIKQGLEAVARKIDKLARAKSSD